MAANRIFFSHVEDLLAPLGTVSVRSMFGGGGVYCDGVMFGLIADDVLYFKADEITSAAYAAEGMGPFIYDGKDKPVQMPYWQVPDRLFDDRDQLIAFARTAYDIARRGKPGKATRNKTESARSKARKTKGT